MRAAIDAAGRVVIPKTLREAIGRGDGGEVEIQLVDGALVVSPPTVRRRVQDGHGRATTATHHGASLLTRDDRVAEVYERIGAEVMWVAT